MAAIIVMTAKGAFANKTVSAVVPILTVSKPVLSMPFRSFGSLMIAPPSEGVPTSIYEINLRGLLYELTQVVDFAAT